MYALLILRYTGPPLIPVLRLKGSPCLNIDDDDDDDDDDYFYYFCGSLRRRDVLVLSTWALRNGLD